jgi:FkbM family methyltransferase
MLSVAQRLLLPLRLRASRRLAGHRIYFDAATDIGMQLLVTGGFEKEALALCAQYIGPDGVVLDVGANIGIHAVHFSGFARNGMVICCEPARSTFALLLRNIQDLSNVMPLNIALSNVSGVQTFFIASDNAYSGLKDTGRKPILRQESIACFTADEILPPLLRNRRVDLIKIDVEGFETQVLQGMQELIRAHQPVIFCEIFAGRQSNPDPQATIRLCVSLGYDAYVLSGTRLIPAAIHDDSLYNYFFIPRPAAAG